MIKFIIICSVSLATYLGFSAINQSDIEISILIYDYVIETSLLTAISIFTLIMLTVIIAMKVSLLIFELPYILKSKINSKKLQKTNSLLMQSVFFLLTGNKAKAKLLSNKVDSSAGIEHRELNNLILAESEENLEQKINYYKALGSSKNYEFFIAKRLAQIHAELQSFVQAENYASKAIAINGQDSTIIEILISCYAHQKLWEKCITNVSKLKKSDKERFNAISKQLSAYYVQASKEVLETGEDRQAINYVESALELNPGNIEALDLYLSINLSLNNSSNNLKILSDAFSLVPSFEVATMYISISSQPAWKIYNELSALVDSTSLSHKSLFLAIRAYLNLSDNTNDNSQHQSLSEVTSPLITK
ncbi:MAG: heme biosynthesis HemY N-terminal domain-containing protein [Janthinobacterium lividum]